MISDAQTRVIRSLGLSAVEEKITSQLKTITASCLIIPFLMHTSLAWWPSLGGRLVRVKRSATRKSWRFSDWACLVAVQNILLMNPSATLVWNACGLNNKARFNSVRDVILSAKADVVCLQETKVTKVASRSQELFSLFLALIMISLWPCRQVARMEGS